MILDPTLACRQYHAIHVSNACVNDLAYKPSAANDQEHPKNPHEVYDTLEEFGFWEAYGENERVELW